MQVDPIIAVKNVLASAEWYQNLLGCENKHGDSKEFAVLTSGDEILLCLHRWGAHEHPTMVDAAVAPGNGLILYFRVDNLEYIRKRADELCLKIQEEVHVNTNSTKKEFSLYDHDGYYITITEFHTFKG
ncbi:MAG: glyoxalase [Cytophagaceae bacterium]|nr:glyoxalase [Cytophagaceae bacterium]